MKKIKFIQYRKLKNIEIDFADNINIIAGTNGTCKSSILHLISILIKKFLIHQVILFYRPSKKLIKYSILRLRH